MARNDAVTWSVRVPLHELSRGPVHLALTPTREQRAMIAVQLALPSIERFDAEVTVSQWLDGCEVDGRWTAHVTQTCGLTLEPLPADLAGEFRVKAVPAGSAAAPSEDPEVMVDLNGDDPPDVLESGEIDVVSYVVEHLALELDPFPRTPGAAFEAPEPEAEESPFAVLSRLKPS